MDARPQLSHWPDGTLMRNRILSYDSTFGRDRTRAITLHNRGVEGPGAVEAGGIDVRPHQALVGRSR